MPAATYVFNERNDLPVNANNTSFTDVPGSTISGLTAGKTYWIHITARFGTASGLMTLRALHGSTVFDESLQDFQPGVADVWGTYKWFTQWTAVGGEDIKLQYNNAGGITSKVDFLGALVLKLSDDFVDGTDYKFNEVGTDSSLSTTPLNGATITITPATAGDNWLVFSYAQILQTNQTNYGQSRLLRSGEASSSTPGSSILNCANVSLNQAHCLCRAFNLGAASNTFTEQSSQDANTTYTRKHSAVFALRLNRFKWSAVAYVDGAINIAAQPPNYGTQIGTMDITPAQNTTMIMGGSFINDAAHYGPRFIWRTQSYVVGQSEADQPPGQTTGLYAYKENASGNNYDVPEMWLTAMAMTGGSTYRTDIDISTNLTTNTPQAKQRNLWAFSVELEGGAAPPDTFSKVIIRAAP